MTYSQVVQSAEARPLSKFFWPALLFGSVLAGYFPTLLSLIDGPWQTEQEGHGPLIMAASLWWVWQSRARLKAVELSPAPIAGWVILLCGLILMYLARIQQGLVTIEMASLLPVIVGCILLTAGWPTLRILAFPIGFLIFAVPMPDWLIDAATVPLKVFISNMVTKVLYAAGYPVAQNGVMIMIGSYQLLVKDACSGMNSIFALSAIGVFYAYAFRWEEKLRSVLLLLAIVPITILANFVRVFTLVLIAYYAGPDLLEGIVHDMTGIGLFIVAVVLMFMFDAVLGLAFGLVSRLRRRSLPEAHPHTA
ncbi:exosortase V [Bradyrhizobium guangdongense]|uniref:Exosortase B n=1 Tax=Bradyrhizobium guangdongense TaxID=1325090 RepID=A0ABX6UEM4_9BRAD|nr:exosortase V [Bradyrhizobium guangdongense]QAU38508.1 exosortase B [Bradyrhizobium guangdongense]QOZ59567.1 exosortase B [Bradyrhizobium guangdongense]